MAAETVNSSNDVAGVTAARTEGSGPQPIRLNATRSLPGEIITANL